MVTRRFLAPVLGAATGLLGACNFSVYDELADEAWVDRVESPDSTDSRQYGEAVIATGSRAAGTNLVVIGKSRASISQLQYDDEGVRQPVDAIDPRQTLLFASFPDNPALAVDSDSDRIAFTVVQGENVDPTRVAVYDGRALGAAPVKSVNLNAMVDVGGTPRHNIYAEGVTFANLPGFGTAEDDLVVSRGPQLIVIQDYAQSDTAPGTTFAVKGCLHGEDWSYGIAVADVLASHAGPEIIVGTGEELKNGTSKILILDPAVVTTPFMMSGNCTTALETVQSTEARDLGAVITTAQFPDVDGAAPSAALADLIYSAPSLNKVFVRFGSGTVVEVYPGEDGSDFGDSIATGDLDGDGIPELVVGAPRSDPKGVTNGGAAYVYKFHALPTPGFDPDPITLHPGEPEIEERFGKSVAIAPFGTGTRSILMIGAEGEVFTYFRTNLYPDVRAGR